MKPDAAAEKTAVNKDKVRESLQCLQPSAIDKENLVSAGRMPNVLKSAQRAKEVKSKSDGTKKTKNDSPKSKKTTYKDKAVQTARGEKIKIEVEDLTSIAGPSENYWEVLAERRRIALEDMSEENKQLTKRIEELEEEKKVYKDMLEETNALVEVLREMIGDDGNDINNSLDDSAL